MRPRFGSTAPGAGGPNDYLTRFDLNANNAISLSDVLMIKPFFNRSCSIAPAAPAPGRSRYVHLVTPNLLDSLTMFSWGCDAGNSPPDDSLVVLNFGQPWNDSVNWGANLHDAPRYTFVSIDQIKAAAKDFLRGYWACTDDTPLKHVSLAIGTNNYQGSGAFVGSAHGQAWADMVDAVNDWIASPPSYASREEAWGANDIQLDWSSAGAAADWANGYNNNTISRYVDYGSAEGCPPAGGVCNNGWSQSDVRYVSFTIDTAWPLPEIYLIDGRNAAQWQRISHDASWMEFLGPFTQWQACQDVGCAPETANLPGEGWKQLWTLLNSDDTTAQLTANGLKWASDTTWQN